MAQEVQVRCITRDTAADPDLTIDAIGGVNGDGTRWRMRTAEAIRSIEIGQYAFYTNVAGAWARVYVRTKLSGKKYLTTAPDSTKKNNLLSLPECPL